MAKTLVSSDNDNPRELIIKLFSNIQFLSKDDLKVLEHLGKKGFYDTQKAKLVPNK